MKAHTKSCLNVKYELHEGKNMWTRSEKTLFRHIFRYCYLETTILLSSFLHIICGKKADASQEKKGHYYFVGNMKAAATMSTASASSSVVSQIKWKWRLVVGWGCSRRKRASFYTYQFGHTKTQVTWWVLTGIKASFRPSGQNNRQRGRSYDKGCRCGGP